MKDENTGAKKMNSLERFWDYSKMMIKYSMGINHTSKMKSSKKTIMFLIEFPQSWSVVNSIYEEAKQRKDIEVVVVAVPQLKSGAKETDIVNLKNPALEYLTDQGIDVIKANKDDNTWVDLKSYNPEYIIYTRPYIGYYPEVYRTHKTSRYAKLIYIPYAYGMLGDKMLSVVLPEHFICYMHRVYFANESRMIEMKNSLVWYRQNMKKRLMYMGFPRFDMLDLNNKKDSSDKKYTIAWMPRWSAGDDLEGQKLSHFLTYKDKFIEYVSKNEDINLIIRPHPFMFSSYISQGIMTNEEVEEFRTLCANNNVTIDEKKDCFETINTADVLVADYTSLIAEYFMTGKPVVFCDSVDGLNVEGEKICSRLYNAESFDKLTSTLDMLKSGNDEMQESRKALINEFLPNGVGNIGKDILNSIINS